MEVVENVVEMNKRDDRRMLCHNGYRELNILIRVLYRRPKARIAHAVKFVCKCQWYLRAHFVAGLLLALFIYR